MKNVVIIRCFSKKIICHLVKCHFSNKGSHLKLEKLSWLYTEMEKKTKNAPYLNRYVSQSRFQKRMSKLSPSVSFMCYTAPHNFLGIRAVSLSLLYIDLLKNWTIAVRWHSPKPSPKFCKLYSIYVEHCKEIKLVCLHTLERNLNALTD